MRIRRLGKADDRSGFHSGQPDLDHWFHRFAGQNQFRHYLGVTYVAESTGQLVGFVTVTPSMIEIDALPPEPRPMFLPLSAIPQAATDSYAERKAKS